MAVTEPDAFRRQDTQVLASPARGLDPHVEDRWDERAPEEYADWPVEMVWREADHIGGDGGESYCRYHEPSGMLLYAEYGFINTCVRVAEAENEAPEIVERYKEGMLDE
jgi:hypothetical protein